MHNGNIGCWSRVKRELALGIGERWYNTVKGGVDSEWGFAIVLEELEARGVGVGEMMGEVERKGGGQGQGIDSKLMREAVLGAIKRINSLTKKAVEKAKDEEGVAGHSVGNGQDSQGDDLTLDPRSLLNFALTDGYTVVCTRYISSLTDAPASLYFSSGTSWERAPAPSVPSSSSFSSTSTSTSAPPLAAPTASPPPGEFTMSRPTRASSTIIIASEPLTFERGDWVTVPVNSVLTVRGQNVLIHPIGDEFYGGGKREGEGEAG